MTELEKSLKNISIMDLNRWIEKEKEQINKEIIRRLKEFKVINSNNKFNEKLKVIEDNKLGFDGFIKNNKDIESIIDKHTCIFSRGYVESDERYRQLVGNGIIIKYKNGKRFYGLLERMTGYTEKSLIGNLGMVGGHINIDDPTIEAGFIRECFEEIKNIKFSMISDIIPLGYIRESRLVNPCIYSDSDSDSDRQVSVSNFHLCVLYILELKQDNVNNTLVSGSESEKLTWIEESTILNMVYEDINDYKIDSWTIKGIKEVSKFYVNLEGSEQDVECSMLADCIL